MQFLNLHDLIPPPLKRESGSLEDITTFGAGGGVVGSFKLEGSSRGLEEEEQVKSMTMDEVEVVERLGALVEAGVVMLEFVSFVFILASEEISFLCLWFG